MCQKAGGAPFMAFAGVKLDELVFTRGAADDVRELGYRRARLLRACGTPLTYQHEGPQSHQRDDRQPR